MSINKILAGLSISLLLSVSSVAATEIKEGSEKTLLEIERSNEKSLQGSKNPHDEIARRMTIINLAEGSDDEVLIAEAALARAELLGYQRQRADRMGQLGVVEANDFAESPKEVVSESASLTTSSQTAPTVVNAQADRPRLHPYQIGAIIAFSILVGFSLRGLMS